jgi:hypothetical protein
MLRLRITLAIIIVALSALAWFLPQLRRDLIKDVITWDAPITDPAPLPAGTGPGLAPVPRTRVVLIDGLTEDVAKTLPAWTSLCKRGVTLRVDVGFPTISLPVEVALWTGLTQQQTGVVFRDRRPLVPPLDKRSIAAQVPRSIAVAEYHGWIVRSLGFAATEPPADPASVAKDANADAWKTQWEARALAAVASDAPLAFVHILRVDTAGHKHGLGAEYKTVAVEADAILAKLVAADLTARWFVLSDHGHVAPGGHGGEERDVRQVQSCIAGPGITAGTTGGIVHAVDVARALADSTGAKLDAQSRGRPFAAAIGAPLERDQAVPPMALGTGAAAIFVLVAGFAMVTFSVRRWWIAPWWFVVACASLFVVRGEPTLSMRMVYAPEGREMYLTWLPALAIAVAATLVGLRRAPVWRVIVSQIALPIAAAAAVITACGAWPAVFGEQIAPVVPRYTAWLSPMLLIVAHGSAAVALAGLATLVRPGSDRSAPPETPHSEPADAS